MTASQSLFDFCYGTVGSELARLDSGLEQLAIAGQIGHFVDIGIDQKISALGQTLI